MGSNLTGCSVKLKSRLCSAFKEEILKCIKWKISHIFIYLLTYSMEQSPS